MASSGSIATVSEKDTPEQEVSERVKPCRFSHVAFARNSSRLSIGPILFLDLVVEEVGIGIVRGPQSQVYKTDELLTTLRLES